MKLKRIISTILAVSILLTASAAALGDYPDLEGHWAKEYMEKLAERGYFTGYEDGSMRPDDEITAAMAFTLLARVFTVSEQALELIADDYMAQIEAAVSSTYQWAYEGISVCLASGVLTESEFDLLAASIGNPIAKEYLAALFIRTMQLDEYVESLDDYEITYSDADSITSQYRPYVYVLTEIGIVEGTDKNEFGPKSNVTRAVVATMLSRALNYMEKNSIAPFIPAYEGISQMHAVISEVGIGYVYMNEFDGLEKMYALDSGMTVTVNGKAGTLTSSHAGCYATFWYDAKSAKIISMDIESDSSVKWAQGSLTRIGSSAYQFTIMDSTDFSSTLYKGNSSTSCHYNDGSVAISKLVSGTYATLKIVNDIVTEVYAYDCSYDMDGTLSAISYGSKVAMTIKNKAGETIRYYLDITDLPTIQRGSATIGIDKLKVGDSLTVTVKYCFITKITAEAQNVTVTGTISSVTYSEYGKTITIKDSSGASASYLAASNVNVWQNDNEILFTDLSVGDSISAVVYGGVITDIYLQNKVTNSTEITGQILGIDSAARQLIVFFDQSLVYVTVPSSATIVSVSGGTIAFSKLTVGSYITAYGAYTSGTGFTATLVLVK